MHIITANKIKDSTTQATAAALHAQASPPAVGEPAAYAPNPACFFELTAYKYEGCKRAATAQKTSHCHMKTSNSTAAAVVQLAPHISHAASTARHAKDMDADGCS
jgi:hypothetical protein